MPEASPTMSRLLERYAQRQPRRALGGLGNLAGVDFQVRCHLAAFVEELASAQDVAGAGQRFLEALSDSSRLDAEGLACLQVKRRLTPAALAKAAEEAVALDEFLEEADVRLHASFRFEVVGLLGAEDGRVPAWDGVRLAAGVDARERRQARLDRMRAAGKLPAPRLEPDPWWRLVAAAWPLVDDPFAFAREALDACLRQGLDAGGAARARNDVAEAFARRRLAPRFPGRALVPADFEPHARQSGEVVLGQVPTLDHLRDGRFMDRPAQVDAALAELDRHVAEGDWRQGPQPCAFWVEGRSGNGKSVLLLEMMRRLVRDRGAHVVWLDDAAEDLLPLLESWAPAPGGAPGPCYVFVDDLYAPNKRERLGLAELGRLVRREARADWPVLVTCGPPEQRLEWAASGGDEVFRAARWLLPPAHEAEKDALLAWFRQRTGTDPRPGPAFGPGDGLMVSMMFELREGRMLEFGRRFHRRLQDLGLVDAVTQVLALNRLYLWAPGDWLDESQSDALRRLNRDHDFSMLSLRGHPGEHLRVTHPHLSDAIYAAIRERDDARVRARDLARAFARSLETDPTVASLILYRVAQRHERVAGLDADELARGMTRAWTERLARDGGAGLDLARMWTNWAVWARRFRFIEGRMGTSPLREAVVALDERHPLWAPLWGRLWSCSPGHPDLVAAAEAWLAQNAGRHAREWLPVWERVAANGPHAARFRAFAAEWLRRGSFGPDWNFVLRALAAVAPDDVPWDVAERLVATCPASSNWAFVYQVCLGHLDRFPGERGEALFRCGAAWLQDAENIETPAWRYVWAAWLHEAGRIPEELHRGVVARVQAWLDGHEDSIHWGYVWRALVDLARVVPSAGSDALLTAGYRWLQGHEDRSGWAMAWTGLAGQPDPLPEGIPRADLLAMGCRWLAGRDDQGAWLYVWEELLRQGEALPDTDFADVVQRGHAWLAGREGNPSWPHAWQALVAVPPERLPPGVDADALRARGDAWLRAHPEDAAWPYAMAALLRSGHDPGPAAPAPCDLAWRWLRRTRERAGTEWALLWEAACRRGHRDPAFLDAGARWLVGRPDAPGTRRVAVALLRAGHEAWTPPEAVRAWVLAKLRAARPDANSAKSAWATLWMALWDAAPSLDVERLGLAWLAGDPPRKASRRVARRLAASRHPEVRAEAEAWFAREAGAPAALLAPPG